MWCQSFFTVQRAGSKPKEEKRLLSVSVRRQLCLTLVSEGRGPLFQAPHWFVELIVGLRWCFPVGCGLQNTKFTILFCLTLIVHVQSCLVGHRKSFFANQITTSFSNKIILVVYTANLFCWICFEGKITTSWIPVTFFFLLKIKGCSEMCTIQVYYTQVYYITEILN